MSTATATPSAPARVSQRTQFRAAAAAMGFTKTISRAEVKTVLAANPNLKWPAWLTGDKSLRAKRGVFRFPTAPAPVVLTSGPSAITATTDAGPGIAEIREDMHEARLSHD